MPYLPESKRLDPTIDQVENYLYEIGEMSDDGSKVIIEGIEIGIEKNTRTGKAPMKLSLHFDHPGAARYINKLKQTVWKELKQYYHMPYKDITVAGYKALPFGYKTDGTYTILSFDVEQVKAVPKGAVPAPIQEEGTTYILNAALNDNADITANPQRQILVDGKPIKSETKYKIYPKLEKLFGPYKGKLDSWLWTYYQQNKVFLKEYGHIKWDPFEFGDRDFVTFFEEHMDKMKRESGIKAGDYTTWNPSDIWAVKGMNSVRTELNKALKKGSLIEMNSVLIHLMEDNELMGISLKMIKSGADAHVKLHNVETSAALKSLGLVHQVEEYTMKDISFRYDNIWEGDTSYVPTQVKLGKKYEVNIRRAGNGVGFNTQIKGAAAQGGQTPTWMVVESLSSSTLPSGMKLKKFSKDVTDYPQSEDDFVKETKGYQTMYEFITKKQSKAKSWTKFQLYMGGFYGKGAKGKQVAIVRCMLITFWYAALKSYSAKNVKSAEFWTDLLYTGMKIKPGREFAPHAKIS